MIDNSNTININFGQFSVLSLCSWALYVNIWMMNVRMQNLYNMDDDRAYFWYHPCGSRQANTMMQMWNFKYDVVRNTHMAGSR